MLLLTCVLLAGLLCGASAESDILLENSYIGNAINLFTNYGDLAQVTQVIPLQNYDDDEIYNTPVEPFTLEITRIFDKPSIYAAASDAVDSNMNILFCDSFEDLLITYYKDYQIEGLSKPWKAFMGDWTPEEIMRSFGLEFKPESDFCCYVLLKLSMNHQVLKVNQGKDYIAPVDNVRRDINKLDFNETQIRGFTAKYGTHYIDSYITGNFIYQVYKFKRTGYNNLKSMIKQSRNSYPKNLRFYFSSYFVEHVGDIRIASGNQDVEEWARVNLKDSRYLYLRPSLLKLLFQPTLAHRLYKLLDKKAVLRLSLKMLKPIFQNKRMQERFDEIVSNDMLLWEANS